ncbi:hypothetical protein LIQ82_04610 [Intestinibacter bartlettii]|uniref:hypothetical protein n=1 Tax=Intestinibacter bartlettii TaxID=261299 RepID=UPI001D00816D|nr:hypothetical protein [Intestinibacter bartlettii]MDU1253630.1 hypothetical protein [Peptostreptococcaceae bacterium]MCB5745576.1 hypothetical protein [Intestinibacter bartlettii]MCC2706116.1 hypothetical protein [Intestinibacter bartlettii]MCC2761566.1 hypothetical protein [Intestinibacter bartlettii]MDU4257618.1 hypothetical protein [Intestinibacter bartlettii]
MFEKLLKQNCFSKDAEERQRAAEELERLYCCEINCMEMDESVRFAHHARGCTIVAAKICENVVIFQNVTVGSNLRYNKISCEWENVGNPIIDRNVVIADGAKVLGPIVISENSVVAAGAIITKDIPPNSVAYGVNKYKPKDPDYDLLFNPNMVGADKLIEANNKLIEEFNKKRGK